MNLWKNAIFFQYVQYSNIFKSFFSKSSASGSSGFGCYNNEANNKTGSGSQGEAGQASTTSLSQTKKKDQKKKSKMKPSITSSSLPTTPKGEDREGQGQRAPSHNLSANDKAARIAALTQALDFIDKFTKNQESKDGKAGMPDAAEINDLATNLQEVGQDASTKSNKSFHFGGGAAVDATKCQITEVLDKEQLSTAVGGFCAAVSLNDGMVLQTTTTITEVLGFPKDMWHGRSFIDFVHSKDRTTFTNKITSTVMLPFGDLKNQSGKTSTVRSTGLVSEAGHSFFCRLRTYNSLKKGNYSVRNQKTIYTPFKLRVDFREIGACTDGSLPASEVGSRSPKSGSVVEVTSGGELGLQSVCLIIAAVPIVSAYTQPDQVLPPGGAVFITRHSAAGTFTKVDEIAIPFLGYLPQDMEGADIFDFYHPKDLVTIKEAYENIMADQKPFKSRPYCFKVKNGCYITLETIWSCFINPWSKKLEFVDGKHTILKGPSNPSVFADPGETPEAKSESSSPTPAMAVPTATPNAETSAPVPSTSDDIATDPKKQKNLQESIKVLLQETKVTTSSRTDLSTHHSSRRRKKLASFMGTLLEEMTRAETPKALSTGNTSVLGNISPHHDETGSESPPSYNQLNYNDNLTRFFNSQPKTLTEKEASAIETSCMSNEECKTVSKHYLLIVTSIHFLFYL